MAKKKNALSKINLVKTDKRASNSTFDEYEKTRPENIENIGIERLKPTPINTEYFTDLDKTEYDNLKADIKKNGILTPLIIDTENNILAGHQRYRIAQDLNLKILPCIQRVFKSETDKELFLINDNLLRRHLSKEQKAVIIALIEKKHGIKYKRGNPDLSNSLKKSDLNEVIASKEVREKLVEYKKDISDSHLRKGRAFVNKAKQEEIKKVIAGQAKINDTKQAKPKKRPAKKTKPTLNAEIKNNHFIIKNIGNFKSQIIKTIEKQFKLNITE